MSKLVIIRRIKTEKIDFNLVSSKHVEFGENFRYKKTGRKTHFPGIFFSL